MKNKKIKSSEEFDISKWVANYMLNLTNHQIRKMTVDRLVHELNMSRAYIYDLCKTHEIMSPGEFLRCEKLSRAAKMLMKSPRLSIKEISKKVGFNTVDYFIRVFKKRFGITPSKYRRFCQRYGPGGVGSPPWEKAGQDLEEL